MFAKFFDAVYAAFASLPTGLAALVRRRNNELRKFNFAEAKARER
jgi:hypothetical protein